VELIHGTVRSLVARRRQPDAAIQRASPAVASPFDASSPRETSLTRTSLSRPSRTPVRRRSRVPRRVGGPRELQGAVTCHERARGEPTRQNAAASRPSPPERTLSATFGHDALGQIARKTVGVTVQVLPCQPPLPLWGRSSRESHSLRPSRSLREWLDGYCVSRR